MADYLTTDTELTSVANAIRTKGGTSGSLVYPEGFVTAIQNLPSGGTDVSDTTAVEADVRTGKYFHKADGSKVQGSIADGTITNNTSGGTSSGTINRGSQIKISKGYYANDAYYTAQANSGTKTISASGDTSVDGYATATVAAGSTTQNAPTVNANGLVTATATVVAGYQGASTKSNTLQLTSQAAQTIHPSTTDQTIASGKYLTGTQTIKAVTTTNLTAANIAEGVTVKIGDSTDDDCVASITGTHSGGGGGAENEIIEKTISGTYENLTVSTVGYYVFTSCSNLSSVSFPNCSLIQGYAFAYCKNLKTVYFPNCTSIGSGAFMYCCNNLTAVEFEKCTKIGAQAFMSCSQLQTATFDKCDEIYGSAFASCSWLTTVSFPNCTSIATGVFSSCRRIATISLPKCTYIGNYAFNKCWELFSVYLLGSSVATLNNVNAFSSTPISTYGNTRGSIFVPASLYNTYKTSTNWVTYADRFVSV